MSRRQFVGWGLATVPAVALAGAIPASKVDAATFPRRRAGKLSVVQSLDFHPDHNALVERKMREFCSQRGIEIDHSYVNAYAGAGNVVQKLTAAVQANDAPDVLIHWLRPAELQFLEVIEDTDSLTKEIIRQHGQPLPAFRRRTLLDGKWWALPHFSRAGGYFVRETPFKEAGIDIRADLTDFDKCREACLKASRPDRELWGWGLSVNRSGDGETNVRGPVMFWGGQLTDESGQLVVLNKDPYRAYAIAALEWVKETYTDSKWAPMVPPGVNAWTDPSNNEAYLAGKIFFTTNAGTMFAKAIVDGNPVAEDTYLIPTPKGMGPGGRSLEGAGDSMNFFIMKGAKNRENAEALIKHMFGEDIYREMFKISTGYVYPAYEWGWDEPVIRDDKFAQHVTPAWRQIATSSTGYTAGEWPGPPSPWVASLESSNFWTDMFGEILNGKPVPDSLKAAHDRAVRVFREFGAKGE